MSDLDFARQVHNIQPLYDAGSRILILGSFPSVASREAGFFYAHPQNRFWRVIAAVFGAEVPRSVEEKKVLILTHGLALYDVVSQCEIAGSSDASLRRVIPNRISPLLHAAPIRQIYVNGKTAEKYYIRYIEPEIGIKCTCLPSTSAANAACSLEALIAAWRVIAG